MSFGLPTGMKRLSDFPGVPGWQVLRAVRELMLEFDGEFIYGDARDFEELRQKLKEECDML